MSIATYEEILDLPNHPEKLLIDVRGADELVKTGQIPTSINIPLEQVAKAFSPETSTEEFKRLYGVPKPAFDHYIIMHCRTGQRSQTAIDSIAALGYTNLEQDLNLPADEFKAKYGCDKPTLDADLIFHCNRGGRAQKGTDLAVSLGFKNARNYKGSWTEWAEKQGK